MSRAPENALIYRPLYDSPIFSVSDYRCRIGCGGPGEEEYSGVNNIVLMRHGAFAKHFGRRSVMADVNQAVFFSKGSTYRVSHPADCGDRGAVFAPSLPILNDIIRELDPSVDDRPERPFPFVTGPCESGVFWRLHELLHRLEKAQSDPPEVSSPEVSSPEVSSPEVSSPEVSSPEVSSIDPLWVDATALQLIAEVIAAAFARHSLPRKRRRTGTDADHAERAEAAKTYLASRLGERITLDDVARAAGASPFHLTRVFQQQTGIPVHRYLNRLRLRAALERLNDGANDLTALALELGFSSHSHFTDSFRREFGRTPSDVRRNTGSRAIREMSKNLEV